MSTNLPGFRSFSGFLHSLVWVKLVTSSIRVDTGASEGIFFG